MLRLMMPFVLATVLMAAKHPPPSVAKTIPSGSKIFIDSNNGFGIFIEAAFQAKGLKVEMVSKADDADYVLDSSLFHDTEFTAVHGNATTYRISEAAFKLTSKSGDIVWAYAVTKGILSRGKQSVAEACAKHLNEIIK